MRAVLPAEIEITSRYWDDDEWWGNQGDSPKCVGYSWSHWLEDGPILHIEDRDVPPVVDPDLVYHLAQLADEWEGEEYEGTSVRAGAQALQALGYVVEYRWALDARTVAEAVLTVGPVVVGTVWTDDMFYPDAEGRIFPTSYEAGGHAYLLNGYDSDTGLFRIKNSWGREWGIGGYAFLHIDDLEVLLLAEGEACLALEQRLTIDPEPEPLPEPEPEPTPEPPVVVPEPAEKSPGILEIVWNWLKAAYNWLFKP